MASRGILRLGYILGLVTVVWGLGFCGFRVVLHSRLFSVYYGFLGFRVFLRFRVFRG